MGRAVPRAIHYSREPWPGLASGAAQERHALRTGRRLGDAGAGVTLEHRGQQAPDVGVVVDDEHVHGVRHLA